MAIFLLKAMGHMMSSVALKRTISLNLVDPLTSDGMTMMTKGNEIPRADAPMRSNLRHCMLFGINNNIVISRLEKSSSE